jgi:hypothetical protein
MEIRFANITFPAVILLSIWSRIALYNDANEDQCRRSGDDPIEISVTIAIESVDGREQPVKKR